MTKSEFYNIVEINDIQVSIPHSSHFTIGTSPYYAHQHALGIDIYHSLHLDNYEVLSPISGEILKVKTLLAPKAKFLGGIDRDCLILVGNLHNPDITYKILHVKPNNIHVGERIEIGDPIGMTFRNGYFANWSSPHIHLEIRPSNDAIRASGGKTFSLAFKKRKSKIYKEERKSAEISLKIDSAFPEFFLGSFPEGFYKKIDPIYGLKVMVNQKDCILDGGVPHYKNGTIISDHGFSLEVQNSIYLGNQRIGKLLKSRGQFGFFKFDPFLKFFLNGEEIRGISLYLANFKPLIKIIPYMDNKITLNAKSTQQLTIIST
ncbi:MAG: hypothetical protein KGD65_10170 [Candidatus Lokiarchaeota archaeon]|nr:hypothetical protein [Candidatus Lokiarchaeota archaeon]